MRLRGFLKILQRLGSSYNSLGKNSALLGQTLLFDHSEDCKYVHEVFIVVPTGVNGHTEVGHVGKLDLEDLRLFLGRDSVYHRDVRNGRPMRQLSLLDSAFFNLSEDLREVLILAWCQSPVPSRSFLKEDFRGLVATQPLKWRLEDLQNAKISWSPKQLACADSARMTNWMV